MKDSISNYIVTGYHPYTLFPEKADISGLRFRFAIVLDSYHPNVDYMHFQDSFFLSCLDQIAQRLDHDTISIHINNEHYSSIEMLRQHFLKTPEEDREPPETIHFKKGEKLVCLEETEFWVSSGGNPPYSDSYTASFYTEENMKDKFLSACSVACETEGNNIKEIIQVSPEPTKKTFSLLKSIKEAFKLKN